MVDTLTSLLSHISLAYILVMKNVALIVAMIMPRTNHNVVVVAALSLKVAMFAQRIKAAAAVKSISTNLTLSKVSFRANS